MGNKTIKNPNAVTIYKKAKLKVSIPFKEYLTYEFQDINDDINFKYALNNKNDFLGFIYIDIPSRFKT